MDANGEISLEDLKRELREDTILVSMMMVNNEIGALEPIENAGEIIKNHNPATVFHVDAIQAYGKFQIIPKRMHIDLLSVSGHKIHGPKGIGFLYIKEKTKIRPISFGGDQQKGMRSGTINVPGIAGLGVAAAEAYAHLAENAEHMYELKAYFADKLQQIGDVTINGKAGHDSAPQIISASFLGVRSEVLLHSLEDRNHLCVSGKCMLFQSSITVRHIAEYWTGSCASGIYAAFQLLPGNYQRRAGLYLRRAGRVTSDAASLYKTLK